MFLIPALNLGGIPPFSGFIGKVALLQAGAEDGSVLAWLLVGGSVLTSLLTLYVVARIWTKAFWRARADAPEGELADVESLRADRRIRRGHRVSRTARTWARCPRAMLVPTIGLVAIGLSLTVFAGPLIDISDRAAENLQDRSVLHRRRAGR